MYNSNEIEGRKDQFRVSVPHACPLDPPYAKIKIFYRGNLKCEMCNHWRKPLLRPQISEFVDGKKGLAPLLNAYAKINKNKSVLLLVVGDIRGGDDTRVFDELKSSIPNAKIAVTGYVSNQDLPSYYSVVDVLVHPSLRDGLPNAVLEAMACGKAVIATPVGGVLELLDDGKNGRIVSINDINSLTTIIQEVLSDRLHCSRLGMAARQTIQSKFTLQNELDNNLFVYCKLGLKM